MIEPIDPRDYVALGSYAEILGRPRRRFNWLGWGALIFVFLWRYNP